MLRSRTLVVLRGFPNEKHGTTWQANISSFNQLSIYQWLPKSQFIYIATTQCILKPVALNATQNSGEGFLLMIAEIFEALQHAKYFHAIIPQCLLTELPIDGFPIKRPPERLYCAKRHHFRSLHFA
jgi:hypothetical protein